MFRVTYVFAAYYLVLYMCCLQYLSAVLKAIKIKKKRGYWNGKNPDIA